MSTKQELIAQARALGQAIAGHEIVTKLRAAQQAIAGDDAAQKLLKDYQAQAERVQQLQAGGQPIEPEDKRKLAELEQQMPSNDGIRTLMRYQADYLDLMNQINQAISGPLAMTSPTGGQDAGPAQ